MAPGDQSTTAAGAAPCTTARFVVRELPGRGRGLVAVGDVASGEQLAAFAAYSHSCDTRASECAATSQCCATCLRWGVGLPVRCSGCPAAYCGAECRAAADERGHQLCCAALQRRATPSCTALCLALCLAPRTLPLASCSLAAYTSRLLRIHAMRPKPKPKFSKDECSTACFLLRAFAQRASERQRAAKAEAEAEGKGGSEGVVEGEGEGGGEGEGECGGEGEGGGEPSFEDAMAQEEETEHTAKELSSQAQTPYSNPNRKPDPDPNLNPNPNSNPNRKPKPKPDPDPYPYPDQERAVQLAKLQASGLIEVPTALRLLRVAIASFNY